MDTNDSFLRSPIFWTRCTEWFFSMICFGMTVQYPETEALMFDHGVFVINRTTVDLPYVINEVTFTESGFVRLHFLAIATVAYTWIILPAMILSYFIHGCSYMDKNIMAIILNAVAFLVFMVAGSLVCATFVYGYDSGANATGALCIFTSLIYLGEVCFAVYCNLKATRSIP